MKRKFFQFLILIPVLYACGQENTSKSAKIKNDVLISNTINNVGLQDSAAIILEKYIDTKYQYVAVNNQRLTIENGLPKGGLTYTDSSNTKYVYAIFWTRIKNETTNPFELSLDVSSEFFELPSSPNNYFKIVFPLEKMTVDKAPLFNYGIADIAATLGGNLYNYGSLHSTIPPNETALFYVITLFKKGVNGTMRAGLSLNNGKLYYRVNDKQIPSGQYNLKDLKLKN